MMTSGLIHHQAFENHINPDGHPERVERLIAVREILSQPEFDMLERKEAKSGDLAHFGRVHGRELIDKISTICSKLEESCDATAGQFIAIDADTTISPGSMEALKRLIGGLTDAVDCVFEQKNRNCFVAARPPGHHAEKSTAMGFCLFNGIAATARYAQNMYGVERVAIVDFDVHHGNGTQDIFWDDPSVMFLSTHQMPLFPGTGALQECGAHGNIINAPLSQGDGSDKFKQAFRERILPNLENYKPDLILISAGFDAHIKDPLGGLQLNEDDFDWVSAELIERADKFCDGRLVSVLEGGYDLQGLARSVETHVKRLMSAG